MSKKNYISNNQETPRMFKNEILEKLSHVHPSIPIILYTPVVGYFIYYSIFVAGVNWLQTVLILVCGVFLWSLFEYLNHRFIFHYEPKSDWGKRLHFIIHGVHHDYPNDAKRLVMPPSISIPVAFVTYFSFNFLVGKFANSLFAGFVLGYIYYDTLHFAIHHFPMKRSIWKWLKHYHLRHHYDDKHIGYGISTPIWDYVFRTHKLKH